MSLKWQKDSQTVFKKQAKKEIDKHAAFLKILVPLNAFNEKCPSNWGIKNRSTTFQAQQRQKLKNRQLLSKFPGSYRKRVYNSRPTLNFYPSFTIMLSPLLILIVDEVLSGVIACLRLFSISFKGWPGEYGRPGRRGDIGDQVCSRKWCILKHHHSYINPIIHIKSLNGALG